MAVNILIINGHDYSRFVADSGFSWSRDDLDTEKSVRTKDGRMRRDRITEKRNLSYTMLPMPEDQAARLDTDLTGAEFTVRYHDMHGEQQRSFYCSQFSGGLHQITGGGQLLWEGISFKLHEI